MAGKPTLALALGFIAMAAVSGWVGYLAGGMQAAAKKPPALIDGISGGRWEVMEQRLDARLRQRFPIGSPASALVAELRREGFESEVWTAGAGELVAAAQFGDLVCSYLILVKWRTDEAGRLAWIKGEYPPAACL